MLNHIENPTDSTIAMNRGAAGLPVMKHIKQVGAGLSEGLILIDVDQRIHWANTAALRMHGVDRLEALGRTSSEYHAIFQIRFCSCAPDNHSMPNESASDAEASPDVIIELTSPGADRPNGLARLRIVVLTDEHGRSVGVAHMLCPVDNPNPTSDPIEVRWGEERFTKTFIAVPVPMLITKLDSPYILDANPAFLAATEHTAASAIGCNIHDVLLWEPRNRWHQIDAALRASGSIRNVDVRVKTTNGDTLDCLLAAETVNLFGDTCALIMIQDVTKRRRDEAHLSQAIQAVMEDCSWFGRAVVEKLASVKSPAAQGTRIAKIGDLTARELEVLAMISHGLTDAQVAEKLRLSRSTVRNHVANLYSKIDVHSRSSAIVWARERGINYAHIEVTKPLQPVAIQRFSQRTQSVAA